ncbi:transcription factor EMB1444-like isoform X3 [Alnus glutinosa]|uniref:transcription factor EMB1444-like isoform X3 n=1 Tax=Alnus glutinosa TaxID=3517 RepID=UPI002D778438|nr:transcription factor EMB1444-like isoform X3 [Alnus glutinosa]
MGTTALRLLLKSLCSNSLWKYAVFWKLKHQSPMILTWEDGYCDYPKPRESLDNISDDIHLEDVNEIYSSSCETNERDGGGRGYPIGLAVADMSCRQYALGEGVVGEVAYTGSHRWVLSENNFTIEFNSKVVPECPDEWVLQFAAGIKTILLVPVLPHGVLQLGSSEWVAEDLAMVAYVRDRFNTLHNVAGINIPVTSNGDILAQASSLQSLILEKLDEPSAITISQLKADLKAFDCIRPNKNKLSTLNEVVPASTVQDAIQVSGTDLPGIIGGASKNLIGVPPNYPIGRPTALRQSINGIQMDMLETKLFGLSCLDKSQAYAQLNNYKMGEFEEPSYGVNPFSTGFTTEQPFGDTSANDTCHKSVGSFSSFPVDSELHEVLGPAFQKHTNEYLCDSSFSVEDSCRSSSLIRNLDLFNGTESSWFSKGDDADYLLQSIVASVSSYLDDSVTNRSNSVRSATTLSGQCADSFQSRGQSEASALMNDDSAPWRHFRSPLVSGDRSGLTDSVSLNNMSTLIDKKQQEKLNGSTQPRKGTKWSNVSKRRARVDENRRTKPRDRQMIQDRLKELRQLVPDGAKCSIDGLLERAVKHMLHLRSVTEQAEKLRILANRTELRRLR